MEKSKLWTSVKDGYPPEAFEFESFRCFIAGYNEFGDLAYEVARCDLKASPKTWDSDLYVTHWIVAFPPDIEI